MREINRSSEETSEILRVIGEIAFQANILALRAAVEKTGATAPVAGLSVPAYEISNLDRPRGVGRTAVSHWETGETHSRGLWALADRLENLSGASSAPRPTRPSPLEEATSLGSSRQPLARLLADDRETVSVPVSRAKKT